MKKFTRRPCNCGLAFEGEAYRETRCHMCWHAMNTPKYQRLWRINEKTLTPEQIAALPKGRWCC